MTNPYLQGEPEFQPEAPAEQSVHPLPGQPNQPVAPFHGPPRIYPTSRYPVVMGAVAGLLGVAAVLLGIAGTGFPSAAPLEDLYLFGLVLDLVSAAIALGICAILFARRRVATQPGARPLDIFPVVDVISGGVAVVAWLSLGGAEMIALLATGSRLRYMSEVLGAFLAGVPWALSFVFGAIGIRRRQNGASRALAILALALGLVVLVGVSVATIVYGLGLSD